MEPTVPLLAARSTWASLIAVAVLVLSSSGVIDTETGAELEAQAPGMIVQLVAAVCALWAFLERIFAKKRIRLGVALGR